MYDLNYYELINSLIDVVGEKNVHYIWYENIEPNCEHFWQQAIPALRKEKNIFMLAEAWQPELLKDHLFDMYYSWDGHHTMNDIAKGKKTVFQQSTKSYNE